MKERLLAEVTIIKCKKDVPTVIEVEGKTYILRHENQYQGGGNRRKKRRLNPIK